MRNVLYRFAAMLLIFLSAFTLQAQDISGIWRGHFTSEYGDQYKIEVQVKQTNKNTVTGVTYSYLTTVFYGKATATGFVKKGEKKVLLQEIKTVEVKMGAGSVACIMKYNLTYTKSGKEEFLEGTYSSAYEAATYGAKKGDNCGGGTVFLRKVPTSDFYVEPFLKSNPVVKKPKTTNTNTVKTNTPKPQNKPNTTTNKPPVVKQTPKTDNKQTGVIKTDTIQRRNTQPIVIEQPKIERPKLTIPVATRSRNNELTQTFTVRNENVIVKLYDNGEIDGDTITVYMDGKPVLSYRAADHYIENG
jgi:hypothetical protein